VKVVFCDNHILVVAKPAGLATQSHPGALENLTELAKEWVKKQFDKPGQVFLEPIHRLDKHVSGLVLFARTSKALSRLQEKMRNHEIKKTYIAQIEGHPPESEGLLEHYLVHDEYRARIVDVSHKEAKLARLYYKVLERFEETSLVMIDLHTGRYHQIRIQFSELGCPILGDNKYGSCYPFKAPGIALHHGRLSFEHPVTKEPLLFELAPDTLWW
jgi:23S rRNA pseudouridine1911/1915/1917 synthase